MIASEPRLARLGATEEESEHCAALIESIRRLARVSIRPEVIDREGAIPRRIIEELAALGVFGLSIPEAHGGSGLSLQGVASVVQALAAIDRSVATTAGLHLGLGARGLVELGTSEQRSRYLPVLASGERIAAFAATEPGAGSDLQAIHTRATLDPADGALVVGGTKAFVTNAGHAGLFTVVASSPDLGGARRGHSLVLVERGDRGVSLGKEEAKLGLRGSSTCSLHLDDVRLPASRLLGPPGRAMEALGKILAVGRTAMAAGCAGAARAALQRAVAHVRERRQFGRPLAELDVVREQLATMAATAWAIESLVRWACAAEDDPAQLPLRSIAAKVLASEGAWEIADLAVQLHGGSGFIEETGVPLILRDARITRIFEGANDVLLVHAGTIAATTRTPREGIGSLAADWLGAELGEEQQALAGAHGLGLLRKQRELHRLGRLAVLSQAADAAALRAAAEGTELARSLSELFLSRASARARDARSSRMPAAPIEAITTELYAGALS